MKTILFVVLIIFGICIILPLLCLLLLFLYSKILYLKKPIKSFYDSVKAQENYCCLSDMPHRIIQFLLWNEDSDFYKHKGYNINSIKIAIKKNRKAKKIIMGGSTISQQLIKNIYFNFKHSYLRKIVELFLTIKLEKVLTKDEILELYLNIIYFGNDKYGISNAANFYFNKTVNALTENQMLILSCIPQAPTAGNPIQHPDVFERLRNKRVDRMLFLGNITDDECKKYKLYSKDCLDPELRANDSNTKNFSQTICLYNKEYGPNKYRNDK